jgi:hypothetical protein
MRHIVRGRAPELEARATLLQARVRVVQRRTRQAETLIAHARRLAQQHELGRIAVQASLAEAERCLAACDWQPAVRTATEALESARHGGLRIEEGIAHRLLGVALLGQDKHDAGVSALICSSTVLRGAGAMLEAGRTDRALEAAPA